jgi:alpha-amylase
VLVENHDTERDGSTLNYRDGPTDTIATEFMLAEGYGKPEVYAGFAFTSSDDFPPSDANGFVKDTVCDNLTWFCQDRYKGIAHMVSWHNYVGNAPIANWADDGVNLIAFSRGHRGWISINNEASAQTKTFVTGLQPGTYCDIIHGTVSNGSCWGPAITVGSGARPP